MTAITFWRLCDSTVTWVTAINQQTNTLRLGEVQPGHLAVGQNSQYAGLGGASLTPTKHGNAIVGQFKKEPRTQYAAGQ